nr:putative leucine-rich repeat protein, plant-type [Tanacetum cinerariifolium]
MGDTRWGLGFQIIFISIISVSILTDTCLGARNITATCSRKDSLALIKFKNSVKDNNGMLSSWVGKDYCRNAEFGEDLDWAGNDMVGAVPYLSEEHCLVGDDLDSSLGELRQLEYLNLSGNDFRKSLIPEFIGTFERLSQSLQCGFQWSHSLSYWKSFFFEGSDLSLARNFASMLNMIFSVSELYLSQCELQKINISLTHLNFSRHWNIKHLDLSMNGINGSFPSFLTNMTSLLSLDLSLNYLNSTVLVMPNLLEFDLSFNMFKYVGIWRQCHLKELIVSDNHLQEEMVGSTTNVSECSQYAFERLYLRGNYLNGSLSESLGRLTNLRDLDLSDNNLAGSVPEALRKLRLLQSLDLSHNHLIGSIPDFLGKPSKLFLAHNQFKGSIPESLGSLTGLKELLLQSNQLTGPIPASLARLVSLQSSLIGIVSEVHFANLSVLKYLNTSYNNKLAFNISREWVPPFQLRIAHGGSCIMSDEFPEWFRTQRCSELVMAGNRSLQFLFPETDTQETDKKRQNQTQSGKDRKRQSKSKPEVKSQSPWSTKVNSEKSKSTPGTSKSTPTIPKQKNEEKIT